MKGATRQFMDFMAWLLGLQALHRTESARHTTCKSRTAVSWVQPKAGAERRQHTHHCPGSCVVSSASSCAMSTEVASPKRCNL